MEEERRKVYVEVDVTHKTDGTARPRKIKFEDGCFPVWIYGEI